MILLVKFIISVPDPAVVSLMIYHYHVPSGGYLFYEKKFDLFLYIPVLGPFDSGVRNSLCGVMKMIVAGEIITLCI